MFNLANWTAYVKERERIRTASERIRTDPFVKERQRFARGIVVGVEPGRSSDGEEFGRPQDGAASPAAPQVGGACVHEALVGHFVGGRPDRCHRLHPRSGLTGHAPRTGPSAGYSVPMGRSGTGAFPPSMISLFSLGDVPVLHADAVAAHGIRYLFSHRLFLAAFSVILVDNSFRFFQIVLSL